MLLLQHAPLQISLALIRLNANQHEEPVPEFVRFNKKIVSLIDIQIFIPDWLELQWSKVT